MVPARSISMWLRDTIDDALTLGPTLPVLPWMPWTPWAPDGPDGPVEMSMPQSLRRAVQLKSYQRCPGCPERQTGLTGL